MKPADEHPTNQFLSIKSLMNKYVSLSVMYVLTKN